ncbi:MAG: hypothetical protein WCJ71_09870, partial [Candidatus Omnitrophota bacterium]
MDALILTECGRRTGWGHIIRCLALWQALTAKGIPTTLVVDGDALAKKRLGVRPVRFFRWYAQAKKLEPLLSRARIVIVDSYSAPLGFYKKISQNVAVPVFLDDYVRIPYSRGIVVNGAVGAEKFGYPRREKNGYLLGADYALLRSEFQNIAAKKVCKDISDVLVTLGGVDRTALIKQWVSQLSSQFPRWRFHVVFGELPSGIRPSGHVRLYSQLNAGEMKRLMSRCDVAICGGGQTTNELAACGVPMIAICLAKNQRLNIRGWQRKGCLMYAGTSEDPRSLERTAFSLRKMTYPVRCRMGLAGQKTVDGRGARRVADSASDALFTFRFAAAGDRSLIFKWANDLEARAVSFRPDPIGWNEHCAWFRSKLEDPDCFYFIVSYLGKPVSQVRFERVGRIATMS